MLKNNYKTAKDLIIGTPKNVVDFQNKIFSDEAISLDLSSKYALLISKTRFGKFQINKLHRDYIQKDIRKLQISNDIDWNYIEKMFSMIWSVGTSDKELIPGTENSFLVNALFQVFDFCYMEEIFNLNKIDKPLSFKSLLLENTRYKEQDIIGLYKSIMDPDDKLRNNMKLFFVRYRQSIQGLDEIGQYSHFLKIN